MEKKYIAHINEELKTEQTVKEHSENVAMLAEEYAVERFKKIAYVTGLLHDCGKYQESFQKRISGSDIRVEHSTCGAIIVKDMSENKSRYPLGFCQECGILYSQGIIQEYQMVELQMIMRRIRH